MFYKNSGYCQVGDKCLFAHGEPDTRTTDTPFAQDLMDMLLQRKAPFNEISLH